MPFEVFRQHQKKLIAIFGIMAMFAFVLSDVAYRLVGPNPGARAGNTVVAKLYGEPVTQLDLQKIVADRRLANRIMLELNPQQPSPFGGYDTASLVDAKILEHEADRLGIPDGPNLARRILLEQSTSPLVFDMALRRTGESVSGDEVLSALSSQFRLGLAQRMLLQPLVTPLDVYQAYRDQSEKSNYRAVGFPVSEFVSKVGEPAEADLKSYFDRYKDVLPDPDSPTPGFKVPRKIKAEILSVDGGALERSLREKLTEAELKDYYQTRKGEFTYDDGTELPLDLFADDPKATLTPQRYRPFDEIKDILGIGLAEQKARDEISEKFARIREEFIDADSDKYHERLDEIAEAKQAGEPIDATLPTPRDLTAVAKAQGLQHEITAPLSRLDAENSAGLVSLATSGAGRSAEGTRFADVLFDARTDLYEAFELADTLGRRYLIRKIADEPARVPELSEVREKVIAAWKAEQARPLAEKAAEAYAAKVKAAGGQIKDAVVDGRPVIAIDSISRMSVSLAGLGAGFGMPTLSEIPQIPTAGPELTNAIFDMKSGEVIVRPDRPKATYYVVALDRRDTPNFDGLFGPNGTLVTRFEQTAAIEKMRSSMLDLMKRLRADAGLPPDWAPPSESGEAGDELASRDPSDL